MTVTNFIPADILKPFIEAYRIIESQEELENRVLPNSSIVIAFRLKGQNSYRSETEKISLSGIAISGLRKSVRLINYSKNTSTLIVLFKECGASFFFKDPLCKLFETSISLDNIINPKEITLIENLLNEAQNNLQRAPLRFTKQKTI
jgi:hypothetical protein